MGKREKYFAGDVINGAVLIERLQNYRWKARCKCGAIFILSPQRTTGKCKDCLYRMYNSELTDLQEQIIVTMCDNSLNCAETGRTLYMTGAAIHTQCKTIKRKTGLDPRNFWDMQKLLGLMEQKKGKKNED